MKRRTGPEDQIRNLGGPRAAGRASGGGPVRPGWKHPVPPNRNFTFSPASVASACTVPGTTGAPDRIGSLNKEIRTEEEEDRRAGHVGEDATLPSTSTPPTHAHTHAHFMHRCNRNAAVRVRAQKRQLRSKH